MLHVNSSLPYRAVEIANADVGPLTINSPRYGLWTLFLCLARSPFDGARNGEPLKLPVALIAQKEVAK